MEFLLDYFSHIDADLLTSRVRSFKEDKYWYWWNTLRLTNKRIEKDKLLASFNPIYRLSGKALILLNKCLSEGDGGHNEVIIPTLLNYENYKILDFGGRGNFVPQGSEDKFYLCEDDLYIWGTMRHKPSFKEDEIYLPNMLYHPVK
ncbi:MAG: hypothetical protein LUG98_14170 [Tannerellaceae bacterium]|nr:hypothetical protein [Tannerellaceae bacterium]